jgi:hypothetical protein
MKYGNTRNGKLNRVRESRTRSIHETPYRGLSTSSLYKCLFNGLCNFELLFLRMIPGTNVGLFISYETGSDNIFPYFTNRYRAYINKV